MAKPSTQRRLFSYLSLQVGGTLVSRALGFVRELVTASFFGAGTKADAFFAALTIPTLFRDVLGEDVVERSFMPRIREYLAKGEQGKAWLIASVAMNWMLVGIAAVTTLIYVAAPYMVWLVAEGLDDADAMQMTVTLTRVLTPFVMFVALAAFAGGMLYYVFDEHLIYSFAPAMLSVGVILGIVFLYGSLGIYSLAIGFVAGAALHFLVQLPSLVKHYRSRDRLRWSASLTPPDGAGKPLLRETGYVTLQSVLTKTTEVFDRRVASFLAEASISSLWFAARLVQLPLAIFSIAISRAVAPYLSEQVGLGDKEEFKKAVLIGYRYNLLFILPTIGMIIALAHPMVRLVFERGNFSEADSVMTSSALWAYAVGLLGMSLYRLGSSVCSALGKNKVPTITAAIGGALNIWLNYVLSATVLEHAGLAMATSIGFSVNALLLYGWLHHHLAEDGAGFTFGELVGPAARVSVNVILSVAASWAMYHWIVLPSETLTGPGFFAKAAALMIALAPGGLVYGLASLANPIEEVKPLLRRLRRR